MRLHARSLLVAFAVVVAAAFARAADSAPFIPPASPRVTYNFNPDWKFIRQDVPDAARPDFDDSKWETVSTPHTWNDVDSYRSLISHSGGDRTAWSGIGWYRKHFKLPASAKGGKVFIEFEGLKQAARFYVNGKPAGKFENGITACGIDISDLVQFGDAENVLAVKVDNSNDYKEEATSVPYEWMGRAFNPNFGGLNHNVWLHLTGKIYQTLPLYENLGTTGVYVYPDKIDVNRRTADIHVEAQVRNESGDFASITLSAVVVDANGVVRAKFDSDASDLVSGQTETFTASGTLADVHFWSPDDPYLYRVYTMLIVDGNVVDVNEVTTGFRKTEFKGGAGTGGVYINDRFTWLTGYAQRSVNDWPGLGQAYPDWMHEFNARLIRSTHANYIRWMHIAPQAADVRACDRTGIVEICPAGDKEGDPANDRRLTPAVAKRQWEQRVEVMRDTMIYYRNNPSILFWEGGNQVLTVPHMQEIVALRKKWDPHGGRVAGTRHGDDSAAAAAITPIAEYYGVMIGQDARSDALTSPTEIFRGYSAERRDRAPLIETEDFREEALRGIWDDFSPPHFGFKKGPNDAWNLNSESFALQAVKRYHAYMSNRIDNPDPAHAKWSGYASIYWSDSDADGRQQSSTVLRVSGKVDGVRLPKEAYYAYRVMQNPAPDLHILGHWTYPAGTKKTMYVIANHCDAIELVLNGKSLGKNTAPTDGYVYAFPDVQFEPGTLTAIATQDGREVAREELHTAGAPKALRLTLHTGPGGLQADGSDVAVVDFEVVDAKGERCPTDEARVDFKVEGPAIWRSGINAAKTNSTNNLYLDTECGINRVALRSTLAPGTITLRATRPGLTPAAVTIESHPVVITNGLMAAGALAGSRLADGGLGLAEQETSRRDASTTNDSRRDAYTTTDNRRDGGASVRSPGFSQNPALATEHDAGVLAPKPLYRDPVYDGAADPSIIYDRAEKTWLMFYTNRRANVPGLTAVTWVHGTPIGIAESADGAHWTYRGTVSFPKDIPDTEGTPTFWAPALVYADGIYHMYVVVVPGIFTDWQHPRHIVHLISGDLKTWHYEATLPLATDKVIDPCIYRLPDGTWRMWYNNERVGKKTYYADSPDLYKWTDKGSANLPRDRGEAPLVFHWHGHYWLLIDLLGNNGLGAFRSDDALHWERQPASLLAKPGTGKDDENGGHHPEVVVSGDRAYLYYFVHPGVSPDGKTPDMKRSSMQVVELHEADGWLTCDRNAPTYVDLNAAAAAAP